MAHLTSIIGPLPLLAALVAIICAGIVQGATGFGFNMVAAPVLAVIDPAFVPVPMILLALLVSIWGALREYRSIDRVGLGYALTGRIVSSVLAVMFLSYLDERTFAIVFAGLVLFAVGLSLAGIRVKATPRNILAAGGISGFMGTLTAIGAPPMAMIYQSSPGPVIRSTLSAYFMIGTTISLILLAIAGHVSWTNIGLALMLAPFAFVGFWLSNGLKDFVDNGRAGQVIMITSTASAVLLVIKFLY
ncbi:sulfite exporter TauE/SafE family protein [Rhodobacteraceae bacterium F11138]|nr:sulfite exporter TauE/SafE family protein [Rhodobacteraceae bacterium F11138]